MSKTFLSIILLTTMMACNTQNGTIERINVEKQLEMAAKDNVVVIDVRTPGEVASGYIKDTDLFIDYNSPNFKEEIAKLEKDKTYVVYCRSGNRSTKALNIMSSLGFNSLYELQHGIMGVSNQSYIVN